jgi:meso-butanediol dehydrogenase/(S,S)-butanediol dehydrogenase/diacetyl reductase
MPPSPIPGRHEGKVAIVTGAGQGIGRSIARRLALEGAHVVVADYHQGVAEKAAREVSAPGREAWAYTVDVGDTDQTTRMARDVVARFGQIDLLVNNAGVHRSAPLLDLTTDSWDLLFRVNLRGLFFCLQAVARQMVAQVPDEVRQTGRADRSNGRIVNIASIAGRSGRPNDADYSASKWGVISVTQSAALYLAPYNITVNAVCPGIVPTSMMESIDRVQGVQWQGLRPGEWTQNTVAGIPLRRACAPEDVAAMVSFLCSQDAEHITGQAINVDGGMEMN